MKLGVVIDIILYIPVGIELKVSSSSVRFPNCLLYSQLITMECLQFPQLTFPWLSVNLDIYEH